MSTQTLVSGPPAAATGRPRPLAAELRRLARRRLVVALALLGVLAVVAAMVAVFATHSADASGARAEAQRQAQQIAAANAGDPSCTDPDACYAPTADDLFEDPRFTAGSLVDVAMLVGGGAALLAVLVGGTAMGADLASRAMVTLLSWEPRRLRFLGTRYAAVAIASLAIGVLLQALALGLGALTVQLRGTWDVGRRVWPPLLWLELRTLVLVVLAGLVAAGLTTLVRHTGGLLGVLFGYTVLVETVVNIVGTERGWTRWLVSQNLAAYLLPGGNTVYVRYDETGGGDDVTIHLSHWAGLGYLAAVTAAALVAGALVLRRRDL